MSSSDDPRGSWRDIAAASTIYFAFSALFHLAWETVQLPLYTLWSSGRPGQIAFAVLHCTAGDVLIAAVTLALALVVTGGRHWPAERRIVVPITAIISSIGYTGFSEWRNVYVKAAWAYAPAMPTVEVSGYAIGLSPLLQWLVVPTIAFWLTYRRLPNT